MSGEFHVDRLRFVGPAGSQSYEFTKRVTVITGPVGSGKTSILDAIAYALGASWTPGKKIRPALDAVEINCRIGSDAITIFRPLHGSTGTVSVTVNDAGPQLLPTTGDQDLSLSTVLLGRLGLPIVRVPEKIKEVTGDDRAVSFADVLSLMYLDQDQIDGLVGFSGARHVKWRQTAEVVYGFTTSEIANLQSELGATNGELNKVRRHVQEVEAFLRAVEIPSERDDDAEKGRVAADLAVVDHELKALRSAAGQPYDVPMRTRLAEGQRELGEARERARAALAQVNAMGRVRAQLRADIANLNLAAGAMVLRELEFEQCPRCMSALDPESSTPGHCRLCQQPESPPGPLGVAAELARLERQTAETDQLLAEALEQQSQSANSVLSRQKELAELGRAWDEAAAAALAPKLERIAELSEQRGALLRARDTLDRTARMRAELTAARKERERLRAESNRLSAQLDAAKAEQKRARAVVRLLGERYFELLQQMEMRDLDAASVDGKTFVPLVNGEGIKPLSSGGMKTMASFAYFLAALSIRVRGEASLLPRFMMIDSPRKGHGKNQADEAAMARFYRTLATFARLSSQSDFQVIVADNDSPIEDKELFHIIEFTDEVRSVDLELLCGGDQQVEDTDVP